MSKIRKKAYFRLIDLNTLVKYYAIPRQESLRSRELAFMEKTGKKIKIDQD